MPAYDLNGAYAIFFIVFMLINLYIFVNIILATIYTNYKKHLKEEVKSTIKLKQDKIADAFNLLKITIKSLNLNGEINNSVTEFVKSENEKVITWQIFFKLMKLTEPIMSENQIKVLFQLIDFDQNNLLSNKFKFYKKN